MTDAKSELSRRAENYSVGKWVHWDVCRGSTIPFNKYVEESFHDGARWLLAELEKAEANEAGSLDYNQGLLRGMFLVKQRARELCK